MKLVLRVSEYTTRAGDKRLKGDVLTVSKDESDWMLKTGKAMLVSNRAPAQRVVTTRPQAYATRRLKAEE